MKMMRWAAAAAALCVVVAGCGSDDDNSNNGTPRPTATTRPTNTPRAATPTQAAGATRTPTFTPVSGPTNTPGGTGAGATKVQKFVSGVLGSIASLSDFAGGGSSARIAAGRAAIQIPPIAIPCTAGGTLSTGCTADGSGSQLAFTFNACRNRAGGQETFLDGTIGIDSPGGCPGVPLPVGQPFGVTVDARIEAGSGRNRTAGDFDVSETVTLGSDGSSTVDATGTVATDCTGSVSFETIEPLFYPANAACGTAGKIRVTVDGEDHLVELTAGGGLALDYGADGSVDESFANCTAAGLARCN